jgi:hypothetical protein
MKSFEVEFTNDIILSYRLIDSDVTDLWCGLIQNHTTHDLCKTNHYMGYASKSIIQCRIDRLMYLADLINSYAPDRVIKQNISNTDWKETLNIMHVHFPDLKNDYNYKHIWDELSEYNDIIHWLESTLGTIDSSIFRITFDFNKSNTSFLDIPDSEYKLFTPFTNFGYLLLHYTHVGKHAQELFTVNDLVCPSEQFLPQRTFSASVRMYFTNNFHDTVEKQQQYMNRWKLFYNKRGKDFWKYDIDDPKLGFGYIKIGELISINNQSIPKTPDDMNRFRDLLVNSTVVNWKINGA